MYMKLSIRQVNIAGLHMVIIFLSYALIQHSL